MITEISSLVSSAKTAYDIAKGINSLKAEVKRNESISKILEVLIAVQSQALAVQEKHQSLLGEKDKLSKKLIEFENWSETERQYELKKIASGIFVYCYKKTKDSKDPPHWLCTNCYKKKKASILQLETKRFSGKYYFCPDCKTTIHIPSKRKPANTKQRPTISRGWVRNY